MKNQKLCLAPFTVSDFSRLISWLDDEALLVQVTGFCFNPEKITTVEVKGKTWKSLNMVLGT